jgi:PBSX family phage terminase large subunit
MIAAEGSIRSGKTVVGSFSFVEWAHTTFDSQEFALCGKTIKSLRRNVVTPLKKVLVGRGYKVKDNKNDNELRISKNGNESLFYLFGGKDEASQDLIQGVTLAGIFFDEAALQPESFVNQGIGRCSVDGSKMWFNCNPASPFHWFKTDYIDKAEEKRLLVIHFELDDNKTLSQAIKDRYKRMFTGVFYQRYILGLWVMASGIIYDCFNSSKHVKEKRDFNRYAVGVDYGIANPTAFVKLGYNSAKDMQVVDEYYHNGRETKKQKTDSEYADDLEKFCGGDKTMAIILDPSALSFKVELRRRGFTNVRDAKNSVLDGIRFVASALHEDRLSIANHCTNILKEFMAYIWDEKRQCKGEDVPIKSHDHALDALRYLIYTLFGRGSVDGSREFRL